MKKLLYISLSLLFFYIVSCTGSLEEINYDNPDDGSSENGDNSPYDSQYQWYSYGDHTYALTLDYGTWSEAETEAVSVGGHLVTVDDANENTWLSTTFSNIYSRLYSDNAYESLVWIGLAGVPETGGTSAETIDDLWWVSGSTVSYVAVIWNSGWADSSGTHAYLHTDTHYNPGTWWNSDIHDTDYDNNPRGIIEIE